jgi:ACS family hexuronate transporter-like MFS transporter
MQQKNYRNIIITLLFSLDLISYIDRSAIAYAVPLILVSLHLDTGSMGLILGAFGIGYFITTLCGGFLADRWGPKIVFLSFSVLWALAMIGNAVMASFAAGYAARFFLGLGEGPFSPSIARSISNWLPEHNRTRALSNTLVSVPLSLAIGAPICTTIISSLGWRWMFGILCVVVLIWWPFCLIFFNNSPAQSRFVIDAEDEVEPAVSQKFTRKDWKLIIRNKTFISNCFGFFVFGYLLFFLMNWLPYYFIKIYDLKLKQVGYFAFLPWILGALFLWCGGYLSDYIYRRTQSLRASRTSIIFIGQFFSIVCIIPLVVYHNTTVMLTFIPLAVAFSLVNNTCFYVTNIDLCKSRSGSLLGIMNAGFALSGFVAPAVTGFLVRDSGNFHSAFYLVFGLTILSLIMTSCFHRPDKDVLNS